MLAWHLRRRRESRNANEYRRVMEILARLTRVEVEITDGVLKNWASEMASLPYIRSVQGK